MRNFAEMNIIYLVITLKNNGTTIGIYASTQNEATDKR